MVADGPPAGTCICAMGQLDMLEQTQRVRAKVNNPYRCYLLSPYYTIAQHYPLTTKPLPFPNRQPTCVGGECVPDSDRCSNMGKCNANPVVFVLSPSQGWNFMYKHSLKFKHLHSMQLCWKQNDRNAALYFRIYGSAVSFQPMCNIPRCVASVQYIWQDGYSRVQCS